MISIWETEVKQEKLGFLIIKDVYSELDREAKKGYVNDANFDNISKATSSKPSWDILEKFELLQMEDQEKIASYFSRVEVLSIQWYRMVRN